jgi:hypothetical protein
VIALRSLQVKVKKAENDLAIEQLRETFRVLAADKVPVAKLEKRLDEFAHKWDDIKKQQPQIKSAVEPVQVRGGAMRMPCAAEASHTRAAPRHPLPPPYHRCCCTLC